MMFNRTEKLMFAATAIYCAIVLSACTVIDTHRKPPTDWPVLQERVVPTGFVELQSICGHGIAMTVLLGWFCSAWTVVNFDDKTCAIYTATDDEYVMEHERDHCKGYDHYGASTLRKAWSEWKGKDH